MARILFVLLVAACVSPHLKKPNSSGQQLREPAQDELTLPDLTFADLKTYLDRYNFSKIRDLLEFLASDQPDKPNYKPYLSHHTFAFASKSLHQSSYLHPRAIVYGRTGKFIITFNGHPKQSGYNLLETVEFNDETKTFEFREIEFLEGATPTEDFAGRGYKISEIGGPKGKCLSCHVNARPIWENYNLWPGMYGGQDDAFTFILSQKLKTDPSDLNQDIKDRYVEFQNSLSETRYASLGNFAPTSALGAPAGSRPNGLLTERLLELNYRRVEKILEGANLAQMTPGQCKEWISKDFIKEAAKILRRHYEHENQIIRQSNQENLLPEEKYTMMYDVAGAEERAIISNRLGSYRCFAKLEHFFPNLKPATFSLTHTEGTYKWNSGVSPYHADIENLLWKFCRRIDQHCQQ